MGKQGQDLHPSARGWLEKAHDAGVWIMVWIAICIGVFFPVRDMFGYLGASAIIALSAVVFALILRKLVAPVKRRRMALDAEQGLFECTLREKGSTSYKRKWALGYAKVEPGRLLFQAKTGVTGPLVGPVETYSRVREVGQPVKAPWSVSPGGDMLTVDTDKGTVELAAPSTSLKLLIETIRVKNT